MEAKAYREGKSLGRQRHRFAYGRIALLLLLGLLAVGIFGFPERAQASHFRYGNLTWEPTGKASEIKFNLTASFRRSGYSGSAPDRYPAVGDTITESIGGTDLSFGDNTPATPTLDFIVTAISPGENFLIGEALDPVTKARGILHTYSSRGPFTNVGIQTSARIGQLNNRSSGQYTLHTTVVLNGNRSPKSTLVPIILVPESAVASFLIPATDPDGDRLRFRLATSIEAGGGDAPPNLSVDGSTGRVTWDTRGLDQTNFWTVQIIIEDLDVNGNPRTQTPVDFLLKVSNQTLNTIPTGVLSPSGPFEITIGEPLTFSVTGRDADLGSSVTLNSGGLPSGATTTPVLPTAGPGTGTTATFRWTPASAQGGSYPVVFSVTDEHGAQSLVSTVIVVRVNTPPTGTLDPPGPLSVTTGDTLSFSLAASDLDTGSTVKIDSDNLPSGLTALPALPATGPGTGTKVSFRWTPTSTQGGRYPVVFSVTDERGAKSLVDTVINVNSRPAGTLIPPGPLSINTGEPLTISLLASDPDTGSTVTIEAKSLPAGAVTRPALPVTGPGTGTVVTIDWTPTSTQMGNFPLTVSITDDKGAIANVTTGIVVVYQPPPLGGFSGFIADAQGHFGMIMLTVAADGTLTGTLKFTPGKSYVIKNFHLDANNQFNFSPSVGLSVKGVTVAGNLRVEITNGANVFDGTLVASLRPPPANARAFTMLLPPNPASASEPGIPQGSGYAVGVADRSGHIRFIGATADRKKFGTGSGIRSDGSVPFFAKLDSSRTSHLHGTLSFTEKTDSDFDGVLTWVKPPALADAFYPHGFAAEIQAIGSRYVNPNPKTQTRVLTLSPTGTVVTAFTGGNLATAINQAILVPPTGDLPVTRPLRSLTLVKSSGLFSGYFVHDDGLSKPYQGAVLQKQNRGEGSFLGTNQAGMVTLTP